MAPGGSLKRPAADGQATLDYPDVRAAYVSHYDKDDYVEWLVKAGEYLRCCWHAEDEFLEGRPLTVEDEPRTKHLWDAYSRDDLDAQQVVALQHLEAYVQERIRADRIKKMPINALQVVGGWIGSALVGALTLGVAAAAFVYLAPGAALWAKDELTGMSEKLIVEEAIAAAKKKPERADTSQ